MGILSKLEPNRVFYYFEEICQIPHGSTNTKEISDYCVNFAKEHGLRVQQDDANNVIIWKNGSQGYEDHAPVMLQGHMDMVCEKEADCDIDMQTQGLDLQLEDNVISARGTTLGGDDGIAGSICFSNTGIDRHSTSAVGSSVYRRRRDRYAWCSSIGYVTAESAYDVKYGFGG